MSSKVKKIRAWLRLFRAHTAILETPMAVIGAALALGTLWDYRILYWIPFGIIYHFAGYGMNSYVDWKKGFDKDDPRKQHHPLNTGRLKPDSAKKAVFVLLSMLIIYGEWVGGFSMIAHISVSVMLISGISYNYFGKYTIHKYIPISIVHTMVFVYPFLLYADKITTSFILLAAAYIIHHVFQIAISGDVKDIDQDESSLIQYLGARMKRTLLQDRVFEPGRHVYMFAIVLTIAEFALAAFASATLNGSVIGITLVLLLGLWSFYEADKVISGGLFAREARVSHMSRKELASFWMVDAALIPVITYKGFAIIVGVSVIYLLVMSKFMWGTYIKPEV